MGQRRCIDDLLWVVNSPPLIQESWRPKERLLRECIDDEALLKFISDRNSRRVGRYFEDLVHYYLTHHGGAQEVRRGLQIRDDGQTIGELDFVFRHQGAGSDARLVHLETAVKFYLHLPVKNPIGSHYIGPNAKDTLEKKVAKLCGHQLLLSDHPSSRQVCQVDRGEAIEQRGWVGGRIFYHPDYKEAELVSPVLSHDHQRGLWLRRSELDWLEKERGRSQFGIIEKPNWLHGHVAPEEHCSARIIRNRLNDHFSVNGNPVMMVASTNGSPAHEYWVVVSDSWPLQD